MGAEEYKAGRRFEYKVRDDLTANGYEVLRAAGSKGGSKVDLVAFKLGELLLVQCKRNGALPPSEWDRLVEVAGWVQGKPILAMALPRGVVAYRRLLGPKRPRARIQPVEPFNPDLPEVAHADRL